MLKRAVFAFVIFEFLSLVGFSSPAAALSFLAGAAILVFWLSLRDPQMGLYILFGELFIGSRGHLLEYDLGGISVSIRLIIFITVLLAWVITVLRNSKDKIAELRTLPASYWIFLLVIALGALNGYVGGNGRANVFFDVNGYLYLLALPMVWHVLRSRRILDNILKILAAAILVIALKTLFLFFWFAFDLPGVENLYHWITVSDIGEITGNVGSASRIFMQSQFFSLLGIFIFAVPLYFAFSDTFFSGWSKKALWTVVGAAILSVLMSLSRSFWLGGAAAALLSVIMLWKYLSVSLRKIFKFGLVLILIAALEIGFLFVLVNIGEKGVAEAISSRTVNPATEAAGNARLILLNELWQGIGDNPILGSGFGRTLSFKSYLPDRITPENPEGEITTSAFEWGYLDIVLKVGSLGLIVYFLFIAAIFKRGLNKIQISNFQFQNLGMLGGLIALLVLNITTPYLNHPLGIGYLMLCLAAFRDYEQTAG